jgi:Tol biopolymer transport system component
MAGENNLTSGSTESTASTDPGRPTSDRLDSWKEIAAYLRRSERTVRRWERTEGLPTHRHGHQRRASVYAYRSELERWWAARGSIVDTREPEATIQWSAALNRQVLLLSAVVVIVVFSLLAYLQRGTSEPTVQPPSDTWRSTTVTSYPGSERFPSLSPDGQRVVFAWHRDTSDNYDLYVQQVRSGTPVQLTTHPHHDWSPAWSPDGSSIAFIRFSPGSKAELLVMPSLPGLEHRLTRVAPLPGRGPIYGGQLAWSPDGAWIATSDSEGENDPLGLFAVSSATGEKRRLTRPGSGQRDTAPAFAPDGRSLAFVRVFSFGISEIYYLPLSRDFQPAGDATPLTTSRRLSTSPTWAAAVNEVLFSSGEVFTDRRLYRTSVVTPPDVGRIERVPAEAPDATVFTTNQHTTGILYARETFDPNIWVLDRQRDGSVATRVFAPSTWIDLNPQFSRDGMRVAFETSRTGNLEIWTAREDGSQAAQLTSMGGPPSGSPSWSPDGRWIAFTSGVSGRSHVYIIQTDGGPPRRLTAEEENESLPSWSSDGRWIYFGSDKGRGGQIWKVRVPEQGSASLGSAVQVTRNGGILAVESHDGKTLYLSKAVPTGISLWQMELATGDEREILPSLNDPVAFGVSPEGIFFVPRTNLTGAGSIQFFGFKDRSTKTVARVSKPIMVGISAHPNGRLVLYSQVDREETDLILAEPVR